MKIISISIKDFRNIRQIFLEDLKKSIFLLGRNGVGKSSVIEAVRWALYGRAELTDRAGRGSSVLIRDGAKKAEVSLVLEVDAPGAGKHKVLIDRSATTKKVETLINNLDTGEIICENIEEFWQYLGLTREQAEHTARLNLALATGEFGTAIAKEFTSQLKAEDILRLSGEHSLWLKAWAELTPGKMLVPDDIFLLGRRAEQERKDKKIILAEFKREREDAESVSLPVDGSGKVLHVEDIPAVEGRLNKISQRIDSIDSAILSTSGRRTAGFIKADIETRETEIAKIESEIATLRENLAPEPNKDNSSKHELMTRASSIRGKLFGLESKLKSLAEGTCGSCGQEITADYVAGKKKKILKEIEAEKTNLEKTESEARAISDSDREALGAYTSQQRQLASLIGKVENIRIEIGRLEGELSSASNLPDVNSLTKEKEELKAKLSRGNEALQRLRRAEAAKQYDKQVERLEKELEHYEWAVPAFRDGAVMKELGLKDREEFVSVCNEALKPWGYACGFEADGRQLILMAGKPGQLRPWRLLSDGERACVELSISKAYSSLHLCPVLVDNLDRLDGIKKSIIPKVLDFLSESSSTALIAACWGLRKEPEKAELDKAFPETSVYWLSDEGRGTEVK